MDAFAQEFVYVISGLGLFAVIGLLAVQWEKWKERQSWRIHNEYIRINPQDFPNHNLNK